jgi:hypothetical protein
MRLNVFVLIYQKILMYFKRIIECNNGFLLYSLWDNGHIDNECTRCERSYR